MRNRKSATIGITGLALGALLVGLAIVMDSDLGRAVNGIGGVLWFASTGLLTLAAARTRPPARLWVLLALIVITVAFIAKPSAIVPAVFGFVPGVVITSGLYSVTASQTNLPMGFTVERVVAVFVLTVVMCCGSGLLASRKLRAADPAEIF